MRKAFINTVTRLARKDSKIMVVIGDTGFSVFEEFEREFGERFVNVGIAEQNFISFGAGLAAMGMKPFLYNVVSFMTLRALEEIVLDICYQENPVVLVGVGGGHAYGKAGPTHHGGMDLATMSMIPNMTVICPGDPIEMEAAIVAVSTYDKPAYIRIGRNVDPIIHKNKIAFQIGKAIKIRTGFDIAFFTMGTILKDAVLACDYLEKEGISTELYSMHTIKPIDEDVIRSCMKRFKLIVTLEEHSVIGGLGSAVGHVLLQLREDKKNYFKSYGFPDQFAPTTGSREYLNELYGLDALNVAKDIKGIFSGLL